LKYFEKIVKLCSFLPIFTIRRIFSQMFLRVAAASHHRQFRTSVALKVLGAQIVRLRASASAFEKAFAGAPLPATKSPSKNINGPALREHLQYFYYNFRYGQS
jgi:hypothetical protein